MKITITFDELDLKDNLVINTINNLFTQKKAITGNIELKPTNDTPFEECDFVEDVTKQKTEVNDTDNTQKSKGKTKEQRVAELKKYANSIYKDLSDAKKKSLKSFVAFYEKKINEENFTINVENQLKKWFERDKNLK